MISWTPKRGKELTLFFFAKRHKDDLLHVLRENLITGWGMYSFDDVKLKIPANYPIPEVTVDNYGGRVLPSKAVCVFVSYYDPNELKDFLWYILDHNETLARHDAMQKEALHNRKWDEKWEKDPNPWGIASMMQGASTD